MRRALGRLSLRARIMLIVVGGAIVPLALIGAWLAASAARSGRELLQSELDSSVSAIARRVHDRWLDRAGDLALLAHNDAAQQLYSESDRPDRAAAYLATLAQELRPTISEFTYRARDGRARWSSNDLAGLGGIGPAGGRLVGGLNTGDGLLVRRPVVDSNGQSIGFVDARVLLTAILPTDSLQLIVAGAALRVRNRETQEVVGGGISSSVASSLVSARASLVDPPFDLILVASDARYVQPFAQAARIGLASLMAVVALAFALTAFLARRLTATLAEVVDAADAIAAGDLHRTVVAKGDDEVGRLAAAFNSMTSSLRRTLSELSRRESLAAVGHFAAAMSHEVRNALTGVRLDLQRLRERTAADDPGRPLITRALRNVDRLGSIVTGSLRVAHANPENMRPVALEGVVRAAITASEPAFLESGALAILEPVPNLPVWVRADAGALEQLFINLLINAAQAMTSPNGCARVSIDVADAAAIVRVSDTGHGIPAETLARIGEPFMSSKPKGTGLGLPIARQIAIAHGGDVRIADTGANGTTVVVTLPRTEHVRVAG